MANNIIQSKAFLNSTEGMSKEVRLQIADTIMKASKDIRQRGLNFEAISSAQEGMSSIRVNDNFRIILYKSGDNLFMLHCAKHNDAYKWAERHKVEVNAGQIQINEITTISPRKNALGKPVLPTPLECFTDEDFHKIGVPQEFWDVFRERIHLRGALAQYKSNLSEEAYYVLDQVASGLDKDSALLFYDELTANVEIPTTCLFAEVSESDLLKCGVPADYLTVIKAIKTDAELAEMQGKLTELVVQNLYSILNGETIAQIEKDSTLKLDETKASSIEEALDTNATQTEFVVVETDEALSQMLDMPMDKWRLFLHPKQRELAERNFQGPVRVAGGAGTGKTVIAVHRAKYLASLCTGNEKVLLTTFSRTLADDISKRLAAICSKEQLHRIIVTNIDPIARTIIGRKGLYPHYNERRGYQGELERIWREAITAVGDNARDWEFYFEEWKDVIQALNIKSLDAYLVAKRVGRGNSRLDKTAREKAWKIFEKYKEIMLSKRWVDIDWAENQCIEICESHPSDYKYIIVDECQDLRAPALRMLRALAGPQHKNDLFFCGDSRQRIYEGQASLSSCGIEVRGRSFQLKMNYRTTAEIYEAACALQKDFSFDDIDDIPGINEQSICITHGEKPVVRGFSSTNAELKGVVDSIKAKEREGFVDFEMCIVVRTTKAFQEIEKYLNNCGIKTLILDSEHNDDKTVPGVRLATMHRVKGMEFDCMYLVEVNKGLVPLDRVIKHTGGDTELVNNVMRKDANLLSVAMTRARKFAWISYSGDPSPLLKPIILR